MKTDEITDEEIRVKIAELCQNIARTRSDGSTVYHDGTPFLPDCDLNAMHEAEEMLTATQWSNYIYHLADRQRPTTRWFINSTARQRAIAFLKTKLA